MRTFKRARIAFDNTEPGNMVLQIRAFDRVVYINNLPDGTEIAVCRMGKHGLPRDPQALSTAIRAADLLRSAMALGEHCIECGEPASTNDYGECAECQPTCDCGNRADSKNYSTLCAACAPGGQ